MEKHALYLKQFGDLFQNKVKELIKKNQEKIESSENETLKEVLVHSRFAKELVDRFDGRPEILKFV